MSTVNTSAPKPGAFATTRQMVRIALQYMNARRARTLLTTLAIVLGVGLIFASNLVLPGMLEAFRQTMTAATNSVDLTIRSGVSDGATFSPDAVKTVTGVAGVKAASAVLNRNVALPTLKADAQGAVGSAAQLEIVGLDPATAQNVRAYAMSNGDFLKVGESGKVVLPAGIVDFVPQLKVGTTFPLITSGGIHVYTVAGLLADKGSSTAPQFYMTLEDAQTALNLPGQINAIDVAFEPSADRQAVINALQTALGPTYNVANSGTSAETVLASAQIGFAMFNLMGVLALFIGAFLIFNTFRTIVVERQHDLALLRTVGATRRQVMLLIITEGLAQGVIGTVLGLLIGFGLTSALIKSMGKILGQYMAGLKIGISVTPESFIAPIVLGLVTTLVASYMPARAAARVSPLSALRPTHQGDVRRAQRWSLRAGIVLVVVGLIALVVSTKTAIVGALLVLIGAVILTPALVIPMAQLLSPVLSLWFAREGDIARGNLVRQPGRAAITVSTLMIGLATFVVMGALVSSFGLWLHDMISKNFSSDIVLMPPMIAEYSTVVGANENLGKELATIPGVDTVSGLRYASTTIQNKSVQLLGIDPAAYPKVTSLDFASGDSTTAFAALNQGRNVLLNSITAQALKAQVGDLLVLPTAEGPQSYKVVGIANDLLSFKISAAFISQTNMKTDFHKAEDVLLMITVSKGADKNAVFAQVQSKLVNYPQFTASLTSDYGATWQNLIDVVLNLFYIIGLIILIPSVLGLVNTMIINVMERSREIGVIRAIGSSRRQVRRMITAETLLLGLFGALIGVITGVMLGYGFIAAFGAVGWSFPFIFPVVGVIGAVLLAILFAWLAAIIPARHAAKLDMIRALQYE